MRFPLFLITVGVTAVAAIPSELKSDAAPGARKFEFVGINVSGPEFGEKKFPGVKGKDYVWPKLESIDHFIAKGMNTFRINTLMERLTPNKLTAPLNPEYLKDLKATVEYITRKGKYAIIAPHNFGRYYEKVITDVAGFEAHWKSVATVFKNNDKVIFDTSNEYHDMDQSLVVKLNQAAINGVRAAGATKQYIHVEGNSYSGAWVWVKGSQNGATMQKLTDPSNKIVYQLHQYLDKDGSGTHDECVSATIGVERLRDATAWLKQNKKIAVLGEFAGGNNPQCKTAIQGMLKYLQENSDVWKGWLWWSSGPWWADYRFSMEPSAGKAYAPYLNLIMQYA